MEEREERLGTKHYALWTKDRRPMTPIKRDKGRKNAG